MSIHASRMKLKKVFSRASASRVFTVNKRFFHNPFPHRGKFTNPFKRTSPPQTGPIPIPPTARELFIQMYDYIGKKAVLYRFEKKGWVTNFLFWNGIAIPGGYAANSLSHLMPMGMWVDWIFWIVCFTPNLPYFLGAMPWIGKKWPITLLVHGFCIPWLAFYGASLGVLWNQYILNGNDSWRAALTLGGFGMFIFWRFFPQFQINIMITDAFRKYNIASHGKARKRTQEVKEWNKKRKTMRKDWWMNI